ncbi:protein Lines homolog 1 isoform X2 [Tiliqua scincoides]|uniref:protein Lines homolog 1 isoform X2 n=1 Tax=Tiliqua scincoides TaxID=71010 RepID=UPI003462ED2D
MGNLFLLLQQMYNDILAGAPFAKDCHSCAAVLDPTVLLPEPGASCHETCLLSSKPAAWSSSSDSLALKRNDKPGKFENVSHSVCSPREIMLLQLTLIKMMLAKLQSQGVEDGLKQKYLDIFGILLKEANIDSKLICLLGSSDKLLSHMAAKSLVSLVHFQLTEEGSLNSTWLSFCLETLSGFPSSCHVAECLWTLTNIMKEILKDEGLCTGGTLRKIFTPLDSILEGLYHSVMAHPDVLQDAPESAKITNNLSNFLDLLELLVASRIRAPLNVACQTLLFRDTSGVLGLITLPVHDLIKKKAILLLKRCILHKACEDLLEGKAPSTSLQQPPVERDRSTFADTVLQFVNSGGLNRLSVSEKASHFGGTLDRPDGAVHSGSGQVILRAVSLVLLKALEIKIQDSTSDAEAEAHLESVMHPLLTFLKTSLSSSPCVHPFEHPCMWLSVLFIEQDDDMLEAAKALLTVYLQYESC